jgi:energy-coupling factor transporter ATP-binding protein EcfA2
MEGEEKTLYIRDLIEIPDIRTVIQLEDLKDSNLRRMIIDTFVLTREVEDNLRAIFTGFSGHEGRGIFLKGHFGSGKSHFLSMLSLLLKHPHSWETVLSQAPSLSNFERELGKFRPLVVEISLVQHRSSEFLEDIVLRAIFGTLGDEVVADFEGAETRHEAFSKLKALLNDKGLAGMVILIDELSEFLRSKGDARAYNEDIRFLQYLGEEAGTFPLWVVASLQEWIEETGEIHQDTFNKIKDRYRIRLSLGRAHIEELVSERLIRHREDVESKIGELFDDLKSYFPTFPVS